jgi:hypothetical protein
VETFTVKKDNLRLFTDQYQAEVLDVAGRADAIKKEQSSYPENRPAQD